MEMHQIRYFLAVCDTLNFTRAAEQCHVTQPALTRAIQKLEEELGGLLLRRERNLSHVTDLGQLMRPHLAQMLAEAGKAQQAARDLLKLDHAALNLGVMCTIGPMRFVGFLGEFRRQHPGIEIAIREATPDELIEQIIAGKLDIALLARPDPYPEQLDVQPIYRERYVVGFAVGHRFQSMNAVPLRQIGGERFLEQLSCEHHGYVSEICRQQDIAPDIVFGSEREDWIQAMVAAGLGACLIWESSSTIPGIVTRLIIEPEITREVALVSVAGRRFSPAALAFIRAAKAHRWKP